MAWVPPQRHPRAGWDGPTRRLPRVPTRRSRGAVPATEVDRWRPADSEDRHRIPSLAMAVLIAAVVSMGLLGLLAGIALVVVMQGR